MKEETLRAGIIDQLRRAHFMDYAFLYGEDYVKNHRVWIEWEFKRKLKRMSEAEWEKVTKAYIEALRRDR